MTIIISIIFIAATAIPPAAAGAVPIIGVAPLTTGAGVAVVTVWRFLNNWSKAPRRKSSKINGNNPGKKGIYDKNGIYEENVFMNKNGIYEKTYMEKKWYL